MLDEKKYFRNIEESLEPTYWLLLQGDVGVYQDERLVYGSAWKYTVTSKEKMFLFLRGTMLPSGIDYTPKT